MLRSASICVCAYLTLPGLGLADSTAEAPDSPASSRPAPMDPAWWREATVLDIYTKPAGCTVRLNGYRLVDHDGQAVRTPIYSLRVLPANYRIEVFQHGFLPEQHWVTVGSDGASIRFTLVEQRERRPPSGRALRPYYQIGSRWPVPPCRTLDQRLAALRNLLPHPVTFRTVRPPSGLTEVDARFTFDRPSELSTFAVLMGDWRLEGGVLRAWSAFPSQVLWSLPLLADECSVDGTVRSSAVFEVNLYDPLAVRIAGTTAAARVHFGRLDPAADTDWMELSTRERSIQSHYGFRFPDEPQSVSLRLEHGRVQAQVSIRGDAQTLTGPIASAESSPHVYVGLAGSPNNTLEIHDLHIRGLIDLYDEGTEALLGMGEGFWDTARPVTLYYSGGGCFSRLFHNGRLIAARIPGEELFGETHPPFRRTLVALKAGDVLAFELNNAADIGALHVAAVDNLTERVVLTTNPLTWVAAAETAAEDWFVAPPSRTDVCPFVARGQDPVIIEQYRSALGRDFPGLPLTGPAFDEGKIWLKYLVR